MGNKLFKSSLVVVLCAIFMFGLISCAHSPDMTWEDWSYEIQEEFNLGIDLGVSYYLAKYGCIPDNVCSKIESDALQEINKLIKKYDLSEGKITLGTVIDVASKIAANYVNDPGYSYLLEKGVNRLMHILESKFGDRDLVLSGKNFENVGSVIKAASEGLTRIYDECQKYGCNGKEISVLPTFNEEEYKNSVAMKI